MSLLDIQKILTAPPMIKSLSSSRCAHCASLLAPWIKAFRFAFGSATQYSSKIGVTQAKELADLDTQ